MTNHNWQNNEVLPAGQAGTKDTKTSFPFYFFLFTFSFFLLSSHSRYDLFSNANFTRLCVPRRPSFFAMLTR